MLSIRRLFAAKSSDKLNAMSKKVKRLYEQFCPNHYDLTIHPNKSKMTFIGDVIIEGRKTGRPSRRLTLHQKGLKINKASLIRYDKKGEPITVRVERINLHGAFDEVRIHAGESLYPGKYTVKLEFEGKITRQMNGLYPSYFVDGKKKNVILATQFESHHAREVFPCIDEPEAKATFDLTLSSPANEAAISNTPIKHQNVIDNLVTTTFETTPIMSTYLLAFVVGELEYLEAKTKSSTVVRTYATKANIEYTRFALDVAVRCLDFYQDYFAIDYPLSKCDMIALPDFASGAMENWGCITYREQALLVDPKNTTLATKQYVAMVVAHELAHQWFGNLVTMRWWTDLWLNEGFASWIEYLAVDSLFPEWGMWTQFVVDEQQQSMKLDALEHTHPVEVEVSHPDEIRTIFDTISYSKGASVIKMLHEYLGPAVFKEGLRDYLSTYKYGNTDTNDLWMSLEKVSAKPVKKFMNDWTSKSGFPLLRADFSNGNILLSQERFFLDPSKKEQSSTWPIPLLDGGCLIDIFDKNQAVFEHTNGDALKFNLGQSGFYRVIYDNAHLSEIGNLIKSNKLKPEDRLGILSDLFEATKAGRASTVDALQFLKYFENEDNYAVWDVISSAIGSIRLCMDDEELRESMKPYIRRLVKSQLERLGWDRKINESHFDQLLRPIIIGLAASADETSIVNKSKILFDRAHSAHDIAPELRSTPDQHNVKRGIDIDPDLRGVVFGTIARLGDDEQFTKLVELYHKSNLSEEKNTLAAAITGFRQPNLIKKSLEMINSEAVRLQDVAYWVAYSYLNRHAKQYTWEWMKKNWDWLDSNLGSDLSFYRMPIYTARAFSDEKFKQSFKSFFEPLMSPGLKRPYQQALEMLTWQSLWRNRELQLLKNFFKDNQ